MSSEIGKNITNVQSSIFDENEEFETEKLIDSNDTNIEDASSVAMVLQSLSKTVDNNKKIKQEGLSDEKRIVNIMVFYSDNSFESFVPSK